MKTELCELCNEKLQHANIYVLAELSEGKLKISGNEIGRACEDLFGDSDYEYFYSFDEENTEKLFNLLSENPEANILALLNKNFSGPDCCKKLREFCQDHSIKYSFFSY